MAATPPEASSSSSPTSKAESEVASPEAASPPSSRSPRRGIWIGLGAGVAGAMLLLVAGWSAMRDSSAHCGEGFRASTARCCGDGQTLEGGHCVGRPARCGNTLTVTDGGCVAPTTVISLRGDGIRALPADWEAEGKSALALTSIAPFRIDAFEVSWSRYAACVSAAKCAPLSPIGEPGQPVNNVTAFEAARFCSFAGGSLPTALQLLFAGAGAEGRRYPWGPSGAVCRRAAWGLAEGPCANGSTEPDVTGSHPDGQTPEGVNDLAGNVAEWTIPRPDGLAVVAGGSFRDREASALKTSATRLRAGDQRADDLGFRCAYPRGADPPVKP